MDRIHIYRVTIYTGSEESDTLRQIYTCQIALRDPKNLEHVARSIMKEHKGYEVSCARFTDAEIMD